MATAQTATIESGSRYCETTAGDAIEAMADTCPSCGAETHTEMGKHGLIDYCNRCAWSAKSAPDVFTDADLAAFFMGRGN